MSEPDDRRGNNVELRMFGNRKKPQANRNDMNPKYKPNDKVLRQLSNHNTTRGGLSASSNVECLPSSPLMMPKHIAVPEGLVLGRSRKRDVISVLGQDCSLNVARDRVYRTGFFGFSLAYPVGISCYLGLPYTGHSQKIRPYDESRAVLSQIAFTHPFAGKTLEGIGLYGSTLADVIKIHGQPNMREGVSVVEIDQPGWSPLSSNVYACYDGIEFHLPRIPNCRPFKAESYLKQPVVKIFLALPTGSLASAPSALPQRSATGAGEEG